jgi:UDP-MurNAc hydroxylase
MEISLLGHASLFVRTSSYRILIDPVFWDPHFEEIAEIYPRREVLQELVPEFDILIISHRHLDHFDIRTLAHLPKDVGVLIPHDPLMRDCLQRLGYSRVSMLRSFNEVNLGSATLFTTRSEGNEREFGVVIADDSGVFWNQIDTVVSSETIGLLLNRYARIDFMQAMWQPMLELNYQTNGSLAFPFSAYGQLLYQIGLLRPRAIAPGANGFKYCANSAWLNRLVFPVTRERFCADVREACPDIRQVISFNPGDTIRLTSEGVDYIPGGCSFVRQLFDSIDPYVFSPVKIDDRFIDANEDHYDVDEMRDSIEGEITETLPQIIEAHSGSFLDHKKWNVIYQLEIAFPDEQRQWVIDFSENPIRVAEGPHPLSNLFVYITASALFGMIRKVKGWDYAAMGGFYRMYQKVYKATPYGLVQPEHCAFRDPLALRFNYDELLQAVLLHDAQKWSPAAQVEAVHSASG